MPSLNRLAAFIPTIAVLATISCTAIHVEPLPRGDFHVSHVCIEQNPAVLVRDFVDVVQKGFEQHGITTEIVSNTAPATCEVVVRYTARQTWDIVTFLAKAEIWVFSAGRQIAYAEYHLRGGGGYALTKYEGTEKKMRPVLNQLLREYASASNAAPV